MTDSLSILPDQGRVRVFACPACSQTIALGCERCRFCSVRIDPAAAAAAADLMDRVNLACSEADDIRTAISRDVALAADRQSDSRTLFMVPFLVIRWWVRFGSVRMEDDDLIRARRDMKLYGFFSAVLVAVALLLVLLSLLYV